MCSSSFSAASAMMGLLHCGYGNDLSCNGDASPQAIQSTRALGSRLGKAHGPNHAGSARKQPLPKVAQLTFGQLECHRLVRIEKNDESSGQLTKGGYEPNPIPHSRES